MQESFWNAVLNFVWSKLLGVLNYLPFRKKMSKQNAFILFIDDEDFPIVKSLEDAGWNVKQISDLENLQDENVIRANVIFIDYKGVGKNLSPKDEGLGVINAIKDSYGSKKRVILYSGHTRFTLGKHLDWADGQLPKNSQAYEFINKIESELKQIK